MTRKFFFGALVAGHDPIYADLEDQLEECRLHRWRHGINTRYYKDNPVRLDLSKYCALASTIVEVYESAAEGATLLQSKSLMRESQGASLQKDIAAMAAKALKSVFIRILAKNREAKGGIGLPAPMAH